MLINRKRLVLRVFIYLSICALMMGAIHLFSASAINRIPAFNPLLFPVLTILLLILHITIACFMVMKYWCDRKRLYLIAIACAFAGSSSLMFGTLSSYPGWFLCDSGLYANANDALIFYTFRNMMMMVLFITATILYAFRHSEKLTRKAHVLILTFCIGFTIIVITLSWLYSSHHSLLTAALIDNDTLIHSEPWRNIVGCLLAIGWLITLVLLIFITQLRNIFWFSGSFFCSAYIFTLLFLLLANGSSENAWYHARFFEVLSTLFMFFILLYDVFSLYRESEDKYVNSYQNSIRDSLTRLYNRSHFYDTLTALLPTVSVRQPLSVVVCDLDFFKRINDNYGHIQGDRVIQFAANVLQQNIRTQDTVARIGGEEFALLLVNTGQQEALTIAERIRLAINEQQDDLPERMTISAGVFTTTDGTLSAEEYVKRADAAMYHAKNSGRNQVVVWQE
ncbi:sensor domain-containing diguanylate cyclase [Raoultella ornithinolytica]|uniref:sensor domain-containing diguanylate cyclase n=1 Tax=Raoultella ornithinolytica TaxID=54291 RepID=UPI001912B854|nr:GGDEF domain-containing protein [Raoultella ornithinolytica]QQQ08429.1 GGDEF domain-containing protein [Raoultella ornithinolytica]HEQ3500923.1 GGDEF domain-containing protein [Raoultella ornithinolytica]